MAKTAGWLAKKLPESLTVGLTSIGYHLMPFEPFAIPVYKHPKFTQLFVQAVASNMPGDTENVTATWFGHAAPERITVDHLLAALREQLTEYRTGTRSR